MRIIFTVILVSIAFVLMGCLETVPKLPSIDDLPASPTLKDRNAAVAQAWDKASLDCRAQNRPKGSFCEQLKIEGEFLSCSAERFAKTAQALRYPAPDKIWVWHNCVKTTANLLRDGAYLTKQEIERRMTACQARLDPEPEFPVRQSGWFAPLVALVSTNDKETVQAVLPGDFGVNQSQVALPSCAARFTPQAQAIPEVKPVAMVAPSQVLLPSVAPPQIESSDTPSISKQTPKPKSRNAISANVAKPISPTNASRSVSSSNASIAASDMKGACPIPGACGPSVPLDAVKRP